MATELEKAFEAFQTQNRIDRRRLHRTQRREIAAISLRYQRPVIKSEAETPIFTEAPPLTRLKAVQKLRFVQDDFADPNIRQFGSPVMHVLQDVLTHDTDPDVFNRAAEVFVYNYNLLLRNEGKVTAYRGAYQLKSDIHFYAGKAIFDKPEIVNNLAPEIRDPFLVIAQKADTPWKYIPEAR